MTGMPTASTTARKRSIRSASVRTDPSPVDPATTRASLPEAARCPATRAAPSRSSAPSTSTGVTMAVITAPKRGIVLQSLGGERGWGAGVTVPEVTSSDPGPRAGPGLRGDPILGRHRGQRVVLLGGVHPRLELDDPQFGEFGAEPPVGRVQQAQLLAVGHDLGEQERLELAAFGGLLHQGDDGLRVDAHPGPHLLLEEPGTHP